MNSQLDIGDKVVTSYIWPDTIGTVVSLPRKNSKYYIVISDDFPRDLERLSSKLIARRKICRKFLDKKFMYYVRDELSKIDGARYGQSNI